MGAAYPTPESNQCVNSVRLTGLAQQYMLTSIKLIWIDTSGIWDIACVQYLAFVATTCLAHTIQVCCNASQPGDSNVL